MKKAINTYLVYRPVMDYEESMTPYFVCETREEAEAIVASILDWMDRLAAKLPSYPDSDTEDPEHLLYIQADEARSKILDAAKWPHGIEALRNDIPGGFNYDRAVDHGCLAVMELPVLKPKAHLKARAEGERGGGRG